MRSRTAGRVGMQGFLEHCTDNAVFHPMVITATPGTRGLFLADKLSSGSEHHAQHSSFSSLLRGHWLWEGLHRAVLTARKAAPGIAGRKWC